MDSHHFNPYHHPYYRVGSAVKDHHHHHQHHQSVETAAQAAIVQSRILEMRKEKSRDAARSRRGKENHEFYELAKLLPLPAAITSQLGIMNKASIIRLTISYLKLRDFALNGDPSWAPVSINQNSSLKSNKLIDNIFDIHQGTHILQSLDGFAFALGQDGRFLYISETVSIYLGLSQVEMTGASVFDYTHQQDHAELAEQLGIAHTSSSSSSSSQLSSSPLPPASVGSNASSESDTPTPFSNTTNVMTTVSPDNLTRQFCIRMKSTLTKRGCQHFKSSGYRVVHVISHLRPEVHQQRENNNGPVKIAGLVAVAIALPPPSVNELRLESDMFVMRLGLDFKIIHCEPRISDLLDYTADELTGRNMYSLVHGQDIIQLRKCHLDLIHKGQVMSRYYKIMNKNGGFAWIQTCATLICSNNGTANGKSSSSGSTNGSEDQEQSIISVNYVISGVEYDHVIMDTSQLGGGMGLNNSTSTPPITLKTSPSKRITPSPPSPIPSGPSASCHNSGQHSNGGQSTDPGVRRSMAPGESLGVSNGGSPGHHGVSEGHPSDSSKRRRYTSSPVRPWKSPSPPSNGSPASAHSGGGGAVGPNSTILTNETSPDSPGSCGSPASNLLRHISVIRETPAILKPQVVSPPYHPHHHPHPHHHHPHHHHPAHYHHLVDPYTAAYHLYKNGGSPGGPGVPTAAAAAAAAASVSSPATHHHWGAYN